MGLLRNAEGRHFIPCCAEGTFPEYVKLYEYLPQTNEMRLCFDLEGNIVVYPRTILHKNVYFHLPPSHARKFAFSEAPTISIHIFV